ncbi:MAG: hypothetical protein KDE19_13280 [Caldilineaceae bacterium]|nr:hypothetical protein [Caldilineaceae bacterium]
MMSEHQPEAEETAEDPKEQPTKTEWHLLFAVEQHLALTPVGVGVDSEFPAMQESPKIDVLLLRRTGTAWTAAQRARLPDGIRDSSAVNNLLEFKYTESLTKAVIIQAISYEHYFRTHRRLPHADVRLFVLIAKTPNTARLTEMGFVATELPGVLQGENYYVRHVTLLLLNELRDVPHNAFVKAFASRQIQKRKAFEQLNKLDNLPVKLSIYIQGLREIWSLPKGDEMNDILTPERVMEVGEAWKRNLLRNMTPEELETYLSNDQWKKNILQNMTPEELDTYLVDDRWKRSLLQNMTPEELDTYLADDRWKRSLLQNMTPEELDEYFPNYKQYVLEQGIVLAKQETVRAMFARNFDVAVIADVTGLTVEQVNAMIADQTDSAK